MAIRNFVCLLTLMMLSVSMHAQVFPDFFEKDLLLCENIEQIDYYVAHPSDTNKLVLSSRLYVLKPHKKIADVTYKPADTSVIDSTVMTYQKFVALNSIRNTSDSSVMRDSTGHITHIYLTSGSDTITTYSYYYNASGLLTTSTIQKNGAASVFKYEYTTDHLPYCVSFYIQNQSGQLVLQNKIYYRFKYKNSSKKKAQSNKY